MSMSHEIRADYAPMEMMPPGLVSWCRAKCSGLRDAGMAAGAEGWLPRIWPLAGRVGRNSHQVKWPVCADWPQAPFVPPFTYQEM
jgi:hypothetical protein